MLYLNSSAACLGPLLTRSAPSLACGSVTARRFYATPPNIQPTAPSGLPLRRIFEPTFPLPFRDSLTQWRARKNMKVAEERLLDCIGLRPGSNSQQGYSTRSLDVPVEVPANSVRGSAKLLMNELEISKTALNSTDTSPAEHTVLVHGYGAAKGYFYRNLKGLADVGGTLHALDWLGYGLSTRAKVRLPRFANRRDGVLYAEDWFVTALESWRQQRGIERFALVAHSLGAPISVAYARRFPERVSKLVLVSPASVTRTKYSIPGDELYSDTPLGAPALGELKRSNLNVPPWFRWMWEQHWSPFALVRLTGPWGPKLTSGWTARRFRALPLQDQHALQVYTYSMFNARGSGEYLLNYFLTAGSAGRWPLVERLKGVKCPSLWLYGDKDWMDVTGGRDAVDRLRAMGLEAEVETVSNSGHHLYLDNVPQFNALVRAFLIKPAAQA